MSGSNYMELELISHNRNLILEAETGLETGFFIF
jgi:hypothetical protein